MACVYLCTGKSCRKRSSHVNKLFGGLPEKVQIKTVSCQNVCSGPVVGVELDGRWEWFKKIRKDRHIKGLSLSIEAGKIHAKLKDRRVKKRAGKRP